MHHRLLICRWLSERNAYANYTSAPARGLGRPRRLRCCARHLHDLSSLIVTGQFGGTLATIRLTSPAPAGGLVVTLFSRLPLTATMPPTVTFPGATEETVPITTFPGFSNSTTTDEIDAAALTTIVHNGINVVTGAVQEPLSVGPTTFDAPLVTGIAIVSTLDVNPISTSVTPPPPTSAPATPSRLSPAADAQFAPGQPITFDWSDASGASSYTIQISTTDKFTSTVVNQTASTSQFQTAALPTSRLWRRVRSISSSGTTSNYSSARRFEVK